MSQDLSIAQNNNITTYTYTGTPKVMAKQGYSLVLLLSMVAAVGGCSVVGAAGTVIGETAVLIGCVVGFALGLWFVRKMAQKFALRQCSLQIIGGDCAVTESGERIALAEIHSMRIEHVQKGSDAKNADMRTARVFVQLHNGRSVAVTQSMVSDTTAQRIYADLMAA